MINLYNFINPENLFKNFKNLRIKLKKRVNLIYQFYILFFFANLVYKIFNKVHLNLYL